MIAAYCSQGFDLMADRIGEAFARTDETTSTSELISIMGRTYVEFAADNPTHFDVMFRSGLDSVDDAAHDELEDHGAMTMLTGLVDDLVASGSIVREQAEAVSVVLWSVAHGLVPVGRRCHRQDVPRDDPRPSSRRGIRP